MAESTQKKASQDSPATEGYCSWHQRIADSVRRIRLSEAGNGGTVHYACVHCIRIWKLTPYEGQ